VSKTAATLSNYLPRTSPAALLYEDSNFVPQKGALRTARVFPAGGAWRDCVLKTISVLTINADGKATHVANRYRDVALPRLRAYLLAILLLHY